MSEPVNKPTKFEAADVESGKVFAILGYIFPILFFLPLVSGEKTPYSTLHANQALLLLIAEVISSVLVLAFIGYVFSLVCLAYAILGIVSACNGSSAPFPIIGDKITLIR